MFDNACNHLELPNKGLQTEGLILKNIALRTGIVGQKDQEMPTASPRKFSMPLTHWLQLTQLQDPGKFLCF